MNKLAAVGLAVLFSPVLAPSPTQVQAQDEDAAMQVCESALTQAEEMLVGDRHLWVANIEARDIVDIYGSYPHQKPVEAAFTIDGNAVSDVMNSPRLLASISQVVVDGCRNVGLVSFGPPASDWIESFGLIGNQVRQFECTDSEEEFTPWGYVGCY